MSLSAVSATFSLPTSPLFSTRARSASHSQTLSRNPPASLKGSNNRMRVSVSSSITSLSYSSSRTSSNSVHTIPHSALSSPLSRIVAPDDMHEVQAAHDLEGPTVTSSPPLGASTGTNPALPRKSPSSPSSPLAPVNKPRRQQSKGQSLPGPREAALADALARALTPEDAVTALEEYAWRSLKAGIRVREYCNAADNTVQMCPPRGIRTSMSLLHTPVCLLYPFCLTPGSLVAGAAPPPLSPSAVGHLSKKNLSDTLVRIAREPNEAVAKAHVLELAIEYVGRRWREGDCNFVDAIAKKFADVQLEAVSGAATVVMPTLDLFRYQFGFVDTQQLIGLLSKSVSTATDPTGLLKAWAVRRLAVGSEPQCVASDLYYIRGHLNIQSRREAINKVFSSLALDGREAATQWTPLDGPRSRNRSGSRLSFSRGSKRKTLAIPWLAKLQYDDRRPSLPTHLCSAEPSPTGWSRLGAFGASITDFAPGPTSATMTRNRSLGMSLTAMSTSNLGSTISLGLSDSAGDIRSVLADHLLFLRYRLGPDADGWSLGGGKDKAMDFLENLETKVETKDLVQELRKLFNIPSREVVRKLSAFHERDVSFDLDQYIADIGPQGDEDEVTSHQSHHPPVSYRPRKTDRRKEVLRVRRASLSSIATATTSMSSISMSISSLGDFTICEATRVPMTAKEAEFRFPEPSPVTADGCKPTPVPRFAQSMTHLVRRKSSKSSKSSESSSATSRPGRISAGPTTHRNPAFEEQVCEKKASLELPSLTPPLSPSTSLDIPFDSPSPPPKRLPAAGNRRRSRTIEDRRTGNLESRRRNQFRQCVIVDGAQLVPDSDETATLVMTPVSKQVTSHRTRLTALGSILPLFNSLDLTPAQVESRLRDMVEQESQKAADMEHGFEAEAKARVIWLLEQVVSELTDPSHVAAAERVLERLVASVEPSTPLAQLKAPLVDIRKTNSPGRRDLTIKVPPREVQNLLLDQKSSFATSTPPFNMSGPCDQQTTSPATARSPMKLQEGDREATPLHPTHDTPITRRPSTNSAPPTLLRKASGSLQLLRHPSQSVTHPMDRSPSSGNISNNSSTRTSPLKKSPSTSSPTRSGIFRKTVPPPLSAIPPMPPLPPLPPTPVNVGTL